MRHPLPPAEKLHLRDGTTVWARTATTDDEAALFAFLNGLSDGSRYLRFFTAAANLRREAHRAAAEDDAEHHGLVVLAPGRGVVGHATYVRGPDRHRAEVGVEVADDLHDLGLATLLIIRLARFAEAHRITSFFAEVLPENHAMLAAFRDGFAAASTVDADEVDIEFPTANWRSAKGRFES